MQSVDPNDTGIDTGIYTTAVMREIYENLVIDLRIVPYRDDGGRIIVQPTTSIACAYRNDTGASNKRPNTQTTNVQA